MGDEGRDRRQAETLEGAQRKSRAANWRRLLGGSEADRFDYSYLDW